MKKLVALILPMIVLFGGCSQTASGSVAELTESVWTAQLRGGGSVCLWFDGDRAAFALENGGDREVIAGRYLADNAGFVIFDRDSKRNYGFTYVPKGDTLELRYDGGTLILKQENAEQGTSAF